MKKNQKVTLTILPIFLTIIGVFSFTNKAQRTEYPLKSASELGLKIKSLPYLTKLSLGDPLFVDGLEVELTTSSGTTTIDDYSLFGFDTNNLGTQSIQVISHSYSTSFDVYVTNERVRNTMSSTSDLIISEIVNLGDSNYGVELFNNTQTTINLLDYKLVLKKDSDENFELTLPNTLIENNHTFTISNESGTNAYLVDSDFKTPSLNFLDTKSISLVKMADSITIDQYNFTDSVDVNRRHYKTYQPNSTFDVTEWIDTQLDVSDFGTHEISLETSTVENQAKAFGRYVMFGAGMNAGGRVQEAFTQLKNEFDFMTKASQDYFVDNKDTTIQGYNESGKFVTSTFREAHGRISYIASRSGNTSFIPGSTSFFFSFDSIAPYTLIGIVVLALGGYLIFRIKSKKR